MQKLRLIVLFTLFTLTMTGAFAKPKLYLLTVRASPTGAWISAYLEPPVCCDASGDGKAPIAKMELEAHKYRISVETPASFYKRQEVIVSVPKTRQITINLTPGFNPDDKAGKLPRDVQYSVASVLNATHVEGGRTCPNADKPGWTYICAASYATFAAFRQVVDLSASNVRLFPTIPWQIDVQSGAYYRLFRTSGLTKVPVHLVTVFFFPSSQQAGESFVTVHIKRA
jgi:hypothetical protein